jgi:hypothetical protein
MELSASRSRFEQDDLARRLGAIAANLSRISSFLTRGASGVLVRSLIDESKMFIEEVGKTATVDIAAQLVELQLLLAQWSRASDRVLEDSQSRQAVAVNASEWSTRLLTMSGMLDAPGQTGARGSLVVPHRHKYGVIALPGVWTSVDVAQADEFVVSSRAPLLFSDFWVRRIGEAHTEAFRDAGFYIIHTARSEQPGDDDRENQLLMESVKVFRLALAIATPRFRTAESIGATGGNPDGEVEVRKVFRCPPIWTSPASRREQLMETDVRHAALIVPALASLSKSTRLWKAIVCFMRGLEHQRGDDRLHEFVRSIEGVIVPAAGETKRQFRSRVGFMVTGISDDDLDEIFDIRSAVEHLNKAEDAVRADRDAWRLFRRVDQAEAIARFCILTVLENPELLRQFSTDSGIHAFWREDERARRSRWGEQLRLVEALAHLRYDGIPGR